MTQSSGGEVAEGQMVYFALALTRGSLGEEGAQEVEVVGAARAGVGLVVVRRVSKKGRRGFVVTRMVLAVWMYAAMICFYFGFCFTLRLLRKASWLPTRVHGSPSPRERRPMGAL